MCCTTDTLQSICRLAVAGKGYGRIELERQAVQSVSMVGDPSLSSVPAEPPLLLVAHGSPDRQWHAAADRFLAACRTRFPHRPVQMAFISEWQPLSQLLLAGQPWPNGGAVQPLFLVAGRHLQRDLPQLLQGYPLHLLPPLIDTHAVSEALHARALECWPEADAVVLLGNGSREPDAEEQLFELADDLQVRMGEQEIYPAFLGHSRHDLPATMSQLAADGARRILLLPHMLFPGRWQQRLALQLQGFRATHNAPSLRVAPPLGHHPLLLDLIEQHLADQQREHGRIR